MPGLTFTAPFPQDVPTHPLMIIDYALIEAGDPEEIDRLWTAATELGFWYLNHYGAIDEVDAMFAMGAETLALPLGEKMKFEQGDNGDSFGYKAKGKVATDKFGTLDTVEFFNVAQDDALSWPQITHRTYPATANARMQDTLIPFTRKSMAVNNTFLTIFERRLGLPEGTFAALHLTSVPSGSEARCIRTPPNQDKAGIGAHTDFGTLSIVHNRLGGLQVFPPGSESWLYIKPLPGHAICNVGDTLAIFSGGILRSNVHRVMPPPGEQSQFERYSIAFFTRPNNDVVLRALSDQSPMIREAVARAPEGQFEISSTAGEWVSRRIRNLRLKSRAGWLASLGTEHGGVGTPSPPTSSPVIAPVELPSLTPEVRASA